MGRSHPVMFDQSLSPATLNRNHHDPLRCLQHRQTGLIPLYGFLARSYHKFSLLSTGPTTQTGLTSSFTYYVFPWSFGSFIARNAFSFSYGRHQVFPGISGTLSSSAVRSRIPSCYQQLYDVWNKLRYSYGYRIYSLLSFARASCCCGFFFITLTQLWLLTWTSSYCTLLRWSS